MEKLKISQVFILLLALIGLSTTLADNNTREKIIELMHRHGMQKKLYAPVKISAIDNVISIADQGIYFYQYLITEPNDSADPNIVIDPNLNIPSKAQNIVIATHGFIDKAAGDWPQDIADAFRNKTDPNLWICGFFDWRGGAIVISPDDAAKYARDIAGPRLAKALLTLKNNPQHIHLIAHSAGSWTINSAAKIIAQKTNARIHLTFLDAYVPPKWDQAELGKIDTNNIIWAEHYYTKDITLKFTHADLICAHNVEISKIDFVNDHEFPYRWYYATVAGKYRNKDWEKNDPVITAYKDLHYGFARSKEAGLPNWNKSLKLKKGGKAVKIRKKKNKGFFGLDIFKSK